MKKDRQKLIKLLSELSELYPDMRFGQLVINVAQWAKGPIGSATWDATDSELIDAAEKNIDNHKKKVEEGK